MDFSKIILGMQNYYTFKMDILENSEDKLLLTSQVNVKDYLNVQFYLQILVYKGGSLHIVMTFDEIVTSFENLKLINSINSNNPSIVAYIRDDNNRLELHSSNNCGDSEDMVFYNIQYVLDLFLKENIMTYLKPLTENLNKEFN